MGTMTTPQPIDKGQSPGTTPVLLISLGEASALTLGQGRGTSEDKRKAYN